jgi:rod shape-determining protein MreD
VSRTGLWLLVGFGVLLAVPLQVGVLPLFIGGRWAPHLGVLTVFLVALRYGEGPGVLLGLVMGLVYDRFTVGEVGLHLLLLPTIGVATAAVRRLVPEMTFSGHLALLVVVVVVSEVAGAVLFDLAGSLLLDGTLVVRQLIPAILSNVVWGGLLLFAVEASGRLAREP